MSSSGKQASLRNFLDRLNSDDEYRNQFFTSPNPAEFLQTEAGITLQPNQRDELKGILEDLRKNVPSKTFALTSDGIEVKISFYTG